MIENEFGEINIDSELVLSRDEEIFELTNGCVCCVATARADLLRILEKLLARRDTLDHILVSDSLRSVIVQLKQKGCPRAALPLSDHGPASTCNAMRHAAQTSWKARIQAVASNRGD